MHRPRRTRGPVGMATNDPGQPKPDGPCSVCGNAKWWQRHDTAWICGVCHPKGTKECATATVSQASLF